MFRLVVAILLALVATCANAGLFDRNDPNEIDLSYLCMPNAHWTRCAQKCPATCQDYYPKMCRAMCTPACQCNIGYVKTEEGDCLPFSNCGVQPEHPEEPIRPGWSFYGGAAPAVSSVDKKE